MANCDKVADILFNCDSANLNMVSGSVLVRLEALSVVKNATNSCLLDSLAIIDPDTGVYPLTTSSYYPIKAEWYLSSVKPNYEVVEGTSTSDRYKQTIGKIVITNSEKAVGKQNIKGLNSNLWVIVSKLTGVDSNDDTFHVYGVRNGMKFLAEATSDEFGNRVVGSFMSIAGGEESTPNGVNLLMTSYANTNILFGQRFDPVIIP